jgi:replicative DNA helicase
MTTQEKTERSIIASMMCNDAYFNEIYSEIDNEDYFSDQKCKMLFNGMKSLKAKQLTIDLVTVSNEVKGKINSGEVYEISSSYYSPFIDSIQTLILQLKEQYILRKSQIYVGRLENAIVTNDFANLVDIFDEAQNFINGVAKFSKGAKTMNEIIRNSFDSLLKRRENYNKGIISGILTGVNHLDKKIGGFQPGQLIIIAARPAMGKTSFAVQIMKKAARQNFNVLMYSLEMMDEQIADKIIIADTGVDSERYRNGNLDESELITIHNNLGEFASLPIEIDDKAGNSIQYIQAQATIKKHQNQCDVIVIDYVGLVGNNERTGNREQYIATISKKCKEMAKQLNVPVILLAQLNRDVEKTRDKMPSLSDLRESGSIEQDADIVIAMMRPEYYNLTFNDLDGYGLDSITPTLQGITLFNVLKYRFGGTGIVVAQNNQAVNTFTDVNY